MSGYVKFATLSQQPAVGRMRIDDWATRIFVGSVQLPKRRRKMQKDERMTCFARQKRFCPAIDWRK